MCRFLLVKAKDPISPQSLLEEFAQMAENSRTRDGDRHGDGWGISYLTDTGQLHTHKSVLPVWQEQQSFSSFPLSRIFAVHARSATFKQQMGDISYSQPYANQAYSFVFNGHLEGVSLSRPIAGKTGAEKIWNLLGRSLSEHKNAEEALLGTVKLVRGATRKLNAMNVGVISSDQIIASCNFLPTPEAPDYYKLHVYESESLKYISSEELSRQTTYKIEDGEQICL